MVDVDASILDNFGEFSAEETVALVQAPRTVADVEEIMAKYRKDVVNLYKDQLMEAPDIAGRVLAAFVVAADGTVSESSIIVSSSDDDVLDAALANLLATFKFPAVNAGDVEVLYPFVFSSGKEPKKSKPWSGASARNKPRAHRN